MIDHGELRQELEKSEIVLQVLPVENLVKEWNRRKRGGTKSGNENSAKKAAGYVSPANDTLTVIRICKDLGLNGKYVIKTVGSKQYVIFKGYPGLRTIFTAPNYLTTNPKVVRMAIGDVGVKNSIRVGGMITIVLFAGLEILQYMIGESTLTELVGTLATDLIKVGISTIAAHAATMAIGTASFCAAGPLVVAIIIGVGTSMVLNAVDDHFGLTDKLVIVLDHYAKHYSEKMGRSIREILHDIEREIAYRALNFDIDNPFGR